MTKNLFHITQNHISTPPRRSLSILDRLITAYGVWRGIQNHFPKKSRFTLGQKIDFAFLETIETVFAASYLPRTEKSPYVKNAIHKLDMLKFFLQVAWEIKDIDDKKYITLAKPLEEIGKMLGGWYRNVHNTQNKTSAKRT